MKIIIILAFILIVLSLGSALFFMMKDKGNSKRMLNSLKLRVALSFSLIIFILIAYYMGWINTKGI